MIDRRRAMSTLCAAALAGAALALPAWAQKSPEETVASLKVPDGLEIKLWATEPGVVNPTNMDIDERGRIWVTEGANYRGSVTRPEGDRIVILEDADGDGTAESSKTFAQDPSLFSPLGICKIGNKLYVAQSPNMLVYTIDESGDKPVGKPEVLFTGFGGENHDHGLHAMIFGPDGRMYFNCGNSGGEGHVKDAKGNPIVDSVGSEIGRGGTKWRGKDKGRGVMGYQEGLAFRCNPDGSGFETLGHNFRNNYEVTVDSFGTAWQSDNDDDGNEGVRINYVMEGGDFGYHGPNGNDWGRDKDLFPDQTRQEAHWHQRFPGIVPNLLHTGGGSPTGILVYEGELLPEKYRGALIHCDPGPNVVRAYIPTPSSVVPVGKMDEEPEKAKADAANVKPGAGYKAEYVELIKGADNWFRPADVCVGPDGAVYVADWYDPGVGGHATGDNQPGSLRGRIYRLAPPGFKPSAPKLDLSSVQGQIAALSSPNLATRYLGYQKLSTGGNDAVAALRELYKSDSNPRLRARALWLLARSPEGKTVVAEALTDKGSDIRCTAIRAARLIKMDMPAIARQMLNDDSPAVLRELCLAMSYEPTDKALPVLVALADKYDGADRWYLEAVGIGAINREAELLAAWQKDGKNKDAKAAEGLAWRLKMEMPGHAGVPARYQFITDWLALAPFDAGAGGADALGHDFGPDAAAGAVNPGQTHKGVDGKDLRWEKLAAADGPGGEKWIDFNRFCADRNARTSDVVGYFAAALVSPEDQKARLVLGSDDGCRVWLNGAELLKRDGARALQLGDDVVPMDLKTGKNLLLIKLRQGGGASGLVAAVAAPKQVTFADDFRADAGTQSTSTAVAQSLPPQRTKDGHELPPVAELAALPGDPKAGEAVFKDVNRANCVACHEIGNVGRMVGPPLTTVGQKLSKAQIYEAILYPNNAILMEYENWVVRTKSGDIVSGLKVADTPAKLTIKDTDAKYHDIYAEDVDRKVMQKISIMPEGLTNALTQQELVDLVEFLSTLRNRV